MPRAICLIREQPHYRREAFCEGLQRVGYSIRNAFVPDINQDDVLVIWNCYGANEVYAQAFKNAKAKVVVAENGYIGHDEQGRHLYALAKGHHNGAGSWYVGGEERWRKQNITVKPWREGGDELVILPQRGIGPPKVAMPTAWVADLKLRLPALTDLPVRVRQHPGIKACVPLEEDLARAKAVVTWGSGAAIKALCLGIPAFYDFPDWIGALAGSRVEEIKGPWFVERDCRELMLHRLSWAQWSIAEIQEGLPFRYLLL